jgi:hypothetical protein
MKGPLSLGLVLLTWSIAAGAAPAATGQAPTQSCAVRPAGAVSGISATAVYRIHCPGTLPTFLSVSYDSPSRPGALVKETELRTARDAGKAGSR